MRLKLLAVPASLLVVVAMAAPAQAAVTVSGGTVSSDAVGDFMGISCDGGVLASTGTGTTGSPCATLTQIQVSPGDGADTIDMTGVTAADFPLVLGTNVSTSDSSADSVTGSPLSDTISGDSDDTLNGGAGNDMITGGQSVSGGLGDDTIIEFSGTGTASGGPGDDRFVQFILGAGIEGGTGFDSWDVDFDQAAVNAGAPLTVTLTADQVHVVLGPTDVTVPVAGLEQAYWTLLRGDVQTFDAAAFPGILNLRGMAGVDTLIGGVADDALYGGGGNDAITGGAGSDVLGGGDDNDTIQARDGVADRIDCGAGTDSVVADAVDVVANCETVDLPPVVTPPVVTPPVAVVPETGAITGPAKVAKPK
jgi:Ca2+-binding RTX toxin-like protein